MPGPAKGPRLWLRPSRRAASGRITHPASWIIRDTGGISRGTGCSADDLPGAEEKLAAYIAGKRLQAARRHRDAARVPIADILAIYGRDVAAKRSRPIASLARLARLEAGLGGLYLSDINGETCRAYAQARGSLTAARRELEDLRAAIGHCHREGICREIPAVALPEKPPNRARWLTRAEAARLIWAAWRFREVQFGVACRASRQHVARFILVALYTGTRAGAVCGASFIRSPARGWIDTRGGMFYRRPEARAETKKRQPPVPLPPRLLAHLRRWERRGDLAPVTFNGRPIERMAKAFRHVASDAGLFDVTPHTLRHTAATWLMLAGVPIWEAAGYLGMSPATLARVYGHHHPDHLRAARDAIGRKLVAEPVAEFAAANAKK